VGQTLARFELSGSESQGNNRDFILRYGLAGSAIQAGVSLYQKDGEKYFMALVEPPQRVAKDQVVGREYVFVVDVSGSMHGFPLDTAKALLVDLVRGLRPADKFNVLFFSGGSTLLSERSLPATQTNLDAAVALLESAEAGGGTELLPALQRALALPADDTVSRSFVVVTDGYIGEDKAAFQYVRQHLGSANVFAFGIGSGVNRYLIEGIAKAGLGEPFIVTDPSLAPETAARFKSYITSPVLTRVKVAFPGFDAFDVSPKAVPDVFATRPVVVHGKWRGKAVGKVVLSGRTSRGAYKTELDVAQATSPAENRALPYLWARSRISTLSDFGFGEVAPAEQAEITKLGLKYSLLTQYTSFIAVSHVVRNEGGVATDVTQPLPLPAGVENSAIGGQMMGADEPGLFSLLLACGSLVLGCALFASCRRGFGKVAA
jgi:Ca-activated chloride channel family protein